MFEYVFSKYSPTGHWSIGAGWMEGETGADAGPPPVLPLLGPPPGAPNPTWPQSPQLLRSSPVAAFRPLLRS